VSHHNVTEAKYRFPPAVIAVTGEHVMATVARSDPDHNTAKEKRNTKVAGS